jgi:hypothetical protein
MSVTRQYTPTRLVNSIEQSPWHANSCSASQETPRLLWNPTVHYRVHDSPPMVPILSQTNPLHNFPLYFSRIHSIIILQSTTGLPSGSLPLRTSYCFHACYIPCPSHPWLVQPNSITNAIICFQKLDPFTQKSFLAFPGTNFDELCVIIGAPSCRVFKSHMRTSILTLSNLHKKAGHRATKSSLSKITKNIVTEGGATYFTGNFDT